MSVLRLRIEPWSAWAPGLDLREDWLRWLDAPWPLADEGQPALAEMPAMMRRRIEPLGRAALQPAYAVQGGAAPAGPVVFASRWGELARSVDLLRQLAAGEPLSPTAFSLSVHNAIGALYSIARGDRHNYQAVAAGECSVEAAFIEAAGLLADGAPQVLLVYFDQPLPPAYASFEGAAGTRTTLRFPHAFACLLTLAGPGGAGISLQSGVQQQQHPGTTLVGAEPALPPGLQALRFMVGSQTELLRAGPVGCWHWIRHHAG